MLSICELAIFKRKKKICVCSCAGSHCFNTYIILMVIYAMPCVNHRQQFVSQLRSRSAVYVSTLLIKCSVIT